MFPLGTGGAFTKTNFQNNFFLIKGSNHILVDCGTRAPNALFKLGVAVTDVENFYITHSHADHIGGLEEVMLAGRYIARKKPNIIITQDYQNILWNNSLKGGASTNEVKNSAYLEFEDMWTTHRPRDYTGLNRQAWEIDYAGFNLIFFRTKHYPDSAKSWKDSAHSTGIIIDKRILFSADTRFDKEMVLDIVNTFDIEIIFHDVQFFPGGIHAPFDALCALPGSVRKKMLFMHYPDNYMEFQDQVLEAGFMGFARQHHYYDF